LQEGQAVEFDIQQGRKDRRPPTCDHGRPARRDEAPLPPATRVSGLHRCGLRSCLLVDATRARSAALAHWASS
jgi:hypothetical protein